MNSENNKMSLRLSSLVATCYETMFFSIIFIILLVNFFFLLIMFYELLNKLILYKSLSFVEKIFFKKRNASTPLGIEPRTFWLPVECSIISATEVSHNFSHRIYFRLFGYGYIINYLLNFLNHFNRLCWSLEFESVLNTHFVEFLKSLPIHCFL